MDIEVLVRLSTFAGLFAVFAVWELLAPRRTQYHSRSVRWLNNLAIMVLNGLIVRLGIPLAAVGTAIVAQDQNLGLLNQMALPAWLAMVVAILALDLILYLQHLIFHHVDFLWRLHRMHHADLEVDVTTGLRFHPIEIVLSMAIKMAAVLVLGAPVIAVIAFEVLLNASSLFNHANIRIPEKVDPVHAVLYRDTGHAPGAPLNSAPGNRQQFRLQRTLVGLSVRNLPGLTTGRAYGHESRYRVLPDRA